MKPGVLNGSRLDNIQACQLGHMHSRVDVDFSPSGFNTSHRKTDIQNRRYGFYPISTDGLKRAENFKSCRATLRRIRGL